MQGSSAGHLWVVCSVGFGKRLGTFFCLSWWQWLYWSHQRHVSLDLAKGSLCMWLVDMSAGCPVGLITIASTYDKTLSLSLLLWWLWLLHLQQSMAVCWWCTGLDVLWVCLVWPFDHSLYSTAICRWCTSSDVCLLSLLSHHTAL